MTRAARGTGPGEAVADDPIPAEHRAAADDPRAAGDSRAAGDPPVAGRGGRAAGTPATPDAIDPARAEMEAERDFCLRSIRDLDAEHAAGDIDDADYQRLRDGYTARAAAALRSLAGAPTRPVLGRGVDRTGDGGVDGTDDGGPDGEPPGRRSRSRWTRSGRARSATAAARRRESAPPSRRRRIGLIVVGLAAVAAGVGWAVAASSGTRLPGQPVSGQQLGSEAMATDLTAAQAAADQGDYLTAVRDYQKVLNAQPDQPEALTGEGWVLAQTQQPALLEKGLGLLAAAEKASPDYAPAHVYRGIALMSEGDYATAVPELRWYLAHQPDPQLAPRVRTALQQAESEAAGEGPAPTTTVPAG